MICKQCKTEKAEWWFANGGDICLTCDVANDRNSLADERLAAKGIQLEASTLTCRKCGKKPLSLFRIEKFGRSLFCKVCEQIASYRQNIENSQQKKEDDRRKQLEAVPLRGYESNKRERYTIRCTRCKEKRDPTKIKVVGAICEFCWRPEEKDAAEAEHQQWNRTFKKA